MARADGRSRRRRPARPKPALYWSEAVILKEAAIKTQHALDSLTEAEAVCGGEPFGEARGLLQQGPCAKKSAFKVIRTNAARSFVNEQSLSPVRQNQLQQRRAETFTRQAEWVAKHEAQRMEFSTRQIHARSLQMLVTEAHRHQVKRQQSGSAQKSTTTGWQCERSMTDPAKSASFTSST